MMRSLELQEYLIAESILFLFKYFLKIQLRVTKYRVLDLYYITTTMYIVLKPSKTTRAAEIVGDFNATLET